MRSYRFGPLLQHLVIGAGLALATLAGCAPAEEEEGGASEDAVKIGELTDRMKAETVIPVVTDLPSRSRDAGAPTGTRDREVSRWNMLYVVSPSYSGLLMYGVGDDDDEIRYLLLVDANTTSPRLAVLRAVETTAPANASNSEENGSASSPFTAFSGDIEDPVIHWLQAEVGRMADAAQAKVPRTDGASNVSAQSKNAFGMSDGADCAARVSAGLASMFGPFALLKLARHVPKLATLATGAIVTATATTAGSFSIDAAFSALLGDGKEAAGAAAGAAAATGAVVLAAKKSPKFAGAAGLAAGIATIVVSGIVLRSESDELDLAIPPHVRTETEGERTVYFHEDGTRTVVTKDEENSVILVERPDGTKSRVSTHWSLSLLPESCRRAFFTEVEPAKKTTTR